MGVPPVLFGGARVIRADLASGRKPNVQGLAAQRASNALHSAATGGSAMRFRAIFLGAALTFAVTPAFAAKITVSQYGRLVATLPWAVALETGMFKEAGLDIDGITAGAGGGTSLRNMLAGELPYAELA